MVVNKFIINLIVELYKPDVIMTLYGLVVRLVDYILHLITDVKTLTKIKIRCIKMNHCSVTGWRSYKVQRKVVFTQL